MGEKLMESLIHDTIVKYFKKGSTKCVLDGTEVEACFEESESLESNISDECDNNVEYFWDSMTSKIFVPCCCFV
jgi:hypothetical protein